MPPCPDSSCPALTPTGRCTLPPATPSPTVLPFAALLGLAAASPALPTEPSLTSPPVSRWASGAPRCPICPWCARCLCFGWSQGSAAHCIPKCLLHDLYSQVLVAFWQPGRQVEPVPSSTFKLLQHPSRCSRPLRTRAARVYPAADWKDWRHPEAAAHLRGAHRRERRDRGQRLSQPRLATEGCEQRAADRVAFCKSRHGACLAAPLRWPAEAPILPERTQLCQRIMALHLVRLAAICLGPA